ncbi:branched-chain amino acid transaminase [Acuticoccus sp.]|uniref:branched-chain amino acid transaminase n=1 Tax=Acuticoccus sp. TaxID=1904378 RepID=UPI003B51DD57
MTEALSPYVFMNGEIVPWAEAKIHIFTPAAKYGAAVFEGIRGYWSEEDDEMYLFRMAEHAERFVYSQVAMRFQEIVPPDEMIARTLELVRANDLRTTVHIRTTAWVDGNGELGARGPTGFAVTAVPRALPKRVTEGCRAQVSSWQRIADEMSPMRIKCNANYQNGRLATLQARTDGYDTAILVNSRGKLAEGPSMCFGMVRGGRLVTPSVTSDILESITRETVLKLARDELGMEVVERDIDRSELYGAQEAFFCGTGWEVAPIVNVDGIDLGDGRPGPVVKRLQEVYFDVVYARRADYADWRTPVYGTAQSGATARAAVG